MPLPTKILFVDKENTIQQQTVKTKESGYRATPGYHPTMKVVKCAGCGGVGICEFVNGFNLRDGDRLMEGKPIRGACLRCQSEQDLVPITLKPSDEREYKVLYGIQQALDEAARRGETAQGGCPVIWPLARVLKREQEQAQQENRDGSA